LLLLLVVVVVVLLLLSLLSSLPSLLLSRSGQIIIDNIIARFALVHGCIVLMPCLLILIFCIELSSLCFLAGTCFVSSSKT
jgi:hypothetical protein